MPITSPRRVRRRRTPMLAAAAAVALVVSACGSTESDGGSEVSGGQTSGHQARTEAGVAVSDVAVSDMTEPAPAGADDAPGGGDLGANSPADGVFAGVPVVDGEISHDRSGTLTNGETDFRDIGVDTGLTWQEASEVAREQEFVCGVLDTVAVEVRGVALMTALTTGEPVTSEDLDLTFGYADALEGRVPSDVSAALAELRDAAEQTVGLPAEQAAAGTDVAKALSAATTTLGEAQGPVCSG